MGPDDWFRVTILVGSNLPFAIAAFRFYARRWLWQTIILSALTVGSGIYHVSDSLDMRIILSESQLAILDFFLAFNAIASVAVFLTKWDTRHRNWELTMYLTLLLWILVWVLYNRTGTETIIAVIAAIFVWMAGKFSLVDRGFPRGLDWVNFTLVVTCVGIGVSFFAVSSSRGAGRPDIYSVTHSLWHTFVGLGIIFAPDLYSSRRAVFFQRRLDTGRYEFTIPYMYDRRLYVHDDYQDPLSATAKSADDATGPPMFGSGTFTVDVAPPEAGSGSEDELIAAAARRHPMTVREAILDFARTEDDAAATARLLQTSCGTRA